MDGGDWRSIRPNDGLEAAVVCPGFNSDYIFFIFLISFIKVSFIFYEAIRTKGRIWIYMSS